eukprot:scaffold246504_cov30-Tisochrysis_lutea.AAC.6
MQLWVDRARCESRSVLRPRASRIRLRGPYAEGEPAFGERKQRRIVLEAHRADVAKNAGAPRSKELAHVCGTERAAVYEKTRIEFEQAATQFGRHTEGMHRRFAEADTHRHREGKRCVHTDGDAVMKQTRIHGIRPQRIELEELIEPCHVNILEN